MSGNFSYAPCIYKKSETSANNYAEWYEAVFSPK